MISPQHRVFLECAAEAMEDAGYDAPRYPGLIGVYGNGSETGYGHVVRSQREQLSGVTDWEILLGSAQDFMLSRVAYKLGLTGPRDKRPGGVRDRARRGAHGDPSAAVR